MSKLHKDQSTSIRRLRSAKMYLSLFLNQKNFNDLHNLHGALLHKKNLSETTSPNHAKQLVVFDGVADWLVNI